VNRCRPRNYAKVGHRKPGRGYVTYFGILRPLGISATAEYLSASVMELAHKEALYEVSSTFTLPLSFKVI